MCVSDALQVMQILIIMLLNVEKGAIKLIFGSHESASEVVHIPLILRM